MASGRPDLYAVLGVPRTATTAELTAAYRRRSRATHPDAGGDPLAFRAVSKAYGVLTDEGLRAGYDAELAGETTSARPSARPGRSGTDEPRPSSRSRSEGAGPSDRRPGGRGRAGSPPTSSRYPAGVDLGQIRWAAPFLDLNGSGLYRDRVRVVPGRWWAPVRVLAGLVTWIWFAAGFWIGGRRLLELGTEPKWTIWVLAWWVTAMVVGVQVLFRRIPILLLLAALLALPAYHHPGLVWSWVVFGWLAGGVALPMLRTGLSRPLWALRRVWAGNCFGYPSWGGERTEPLLRELLVIPGARLLHQVVGVEHAVVLDRRVALVGHPGSPVQLSGCENRVWPVQIVEDPQRAVDEIGRWLLDGTDGWTIDRRVLGNVSP